jgi:hypothetical protein
MYQLWTSDMAYQYTDITDIKDIISITARDILLTIHHDLDHRFSGLDIIKASQHSFTDTMQCGAAHALAPVALQLPQPHNKRRHVPHWDLTEQQRKHGALCG